MGETRAKPDEALTALLAYLRAEAYAFTPVTPLTHQQVLTNRGGDLGRALSVKTGTQALQRLRSGGCLILYTGVVMVQGEDHFIRDMAPFLGDTGCTYTYEEIDPDVFGEELARPAYQGADRIAAVGLVAVKS